MHTTETSIVTVTGSLVHIDGQVVGRITNLGCGLFSAQDVNGTPLQYGQICRRDNAIAAIVCPQLGEGGRYRVVS